MSKTRLQVQAHALLLANDTTFSTADAQALIEEIYQRYWDQFLKDRVKVALDFVTFGASQYVITNATAAREILNLMGNNGTVDADGNQVNSIQKDDFHAVVDDADQASAAGATIPLRWGAFKIQGSSFFRIAIAPPLTAGCVLDAEILPEYTPLAADGTTLEGDDVDAFNVARLSAVEIMIRNGDDSTEIQSVFAPLDQAVRDKFGYVLMRGQPNENERKEQV